MYSVNITTTKTSKQSLTDDQVKELVKQFLARKFRVEAGDIITESGVLVREVEHRTSHIWYEREEIRVATELDKAVLEVLKNL
jgi:formylmethanofuran dehydrogenase subunit A